MKKQTFKIGLILILTGLLFSFNGITAFAQTNAEVSQLYTEVLPEYDKPDILVINTIAIKNTSNQDSTGPLKWYIPKGANTLIIFEENNQNDRLTFNTTQNQDYDEVDWSLKTPLKAGETRNIHIEFYYNNIQGSPDKKFSYNLFSPYQITNSQILFGQPKNSTNFKIDPDFGQPSVNQGLTIYSKAYQNIPAGQKQTINVSYTKSDASLSAPVQQNQQQTQSGSDAQTATNFFDRNKIVIIVAAVVLIALIILLIFKLMNNKKILANYENAAYDYINDEEAEIPEKKEEEEVAPPQVKPKADEAQLSKEQKELKEQLKKGLITEDQYYEKLMELE